MDARASTELGTRDPNVHSVLYAGGVKVLMVHSGSDHAEEAYDATLSP